MTKTVEQETVLLCGGPADGKRITTNGKYDRLRLPVLTGRKIAGLTTNMDAECVDVTYRKPYPNAVVMYPEGW